MPLIAGLLGSGLAAGIGAAGAYAIEKLDPNSRTNMARRSQKWLKRHQSTASQAGMKRGIRAQASRAISTDKRRLEDDLNRQAKAGVNPVLLEQRRNMALGRVEEQRAQAGATAEQAAIAKLGQERTAQQAVVDAAPTTGEVLAGGAQTGLGVLSAGVQLGGAITPKQPDQQSADAINDLSNSFARSGAVKLHSVR